MTDKSQTAALETRVRRLERENATLRWVIGVAHQDIREGAPDRAKLFLDHQMKELSHD